MKWITDPQTRKLVYSLFVAILALLSGVGFITGTMQEDLLSLIGAAIELAAAIAFAMAASKSAPAATDPTGFLSEDEDEVEIIFVEDGDEGIEIPETPEEIEEPIN